MVSNKNRSVNPLSILEIIELTNEIPSEQVIAELVNDYSGLTKREWFAGMALQGLGDGDVERALKVADLMLEKLED